MGSSSAKMSNPKDSRSQQSQKSYPTQSAPSAPSANAQGGYPDAPPPYTPYPAPSQYGGPAYPPQMNTGPMPAPYPPTAYGNAPAPNPGYPVQQGYNYQQMPAMAGPAVASFDSGARFDGIASQNIPPPPPGYAPNAAQVAVAQGRPVVASHQKTNWISGSGGGVSMF